MKTNLIVCEKCGNYGASIRYGEKHDTEYLITTCNTCGYSWKTSVIG